MKLYSTCYTRLLRFSRHLLSAPWTFDLHERLLVSNYFLLLLLLFFSYEIVYSTRWQRTYHFSPLMLINYFKKHLSDMRRKTMANILVGWSYVGLYLLK